MRLTQSTNPNCCCGYVQSLYRRELLFRFNFFVTSQIQYQSQAKDKHPFILVRRTQEYRCNIQSPPWLLHHHTTPGNTCPAFQVLRKTMVTAFTHQEVALPLHRWVNSFRAPEICATCSNLDLDTPQINLVSPIPRERQSTVVLSSIPEAMKHDGRCTSPALDTIPTHPDTGNNPTGIGTECNCNVIIVGVVISQWVLTSYDHRYVIFRAQYW